MIVYVEKLQEMRKDCSCGGKCALLVYSTCHPKAGLVAVFEGGTMHLLCRECAQERMSVAVAVSPN